MTLVAPDLEIRLSLKSIKTEWKRVSMTVIFGELR